MTVGLLHALFAYQGRQVSAEELAERACTMEIDRCGKPIGKQDQYAAAFGGICDLRFGPGDQVTVDQIRLPAAAHRELQGELMLFYTGITRVADTILSEQNANVSSKLAQLNQLRDLAGEAAAGLRSGEMRSVGVALGKSWDIKRQLASGVSTAQLDQSVEAAIGAGATGAKITGAGGGGFVLVSCPAESQTAVRAAMSPMKELPISIDSYGSRVIFNVHRDIWSLNIRCCAG